MMSTAAATAHRAGQAPSWRRRQLSQKASFLAAAVAFTGLYVAAGAPTPLLVLFQREWGFPVWVLTVAFAAYALGLLGALLVAGSLSDFLGRKPVLIVCLTVEFISMVIFVLAPTIGWVIAARTLQGVATGAATSAFTAALIELATPTYRKLGSIIGSVAPAGGLAVGALLTGLAVSFTSEPSRLVFTILAVIMAAAALATVYSVETVPRRAGAVRSLKPRVSVPPAARRELVAAVPVLLASWMLAGLFLGLVPTIMRDLIHFDSGLLNGVTVFLEPATAAVTGIVLSGLAARRTVMVGAATILVGTAVVLVGVLAAVLPLLWVGGIIGGVGFGASFSGPLRILGPLAAPRHRAGLFAAVFMVAYLAFGVPAIIAGVLIGPLGLLHTVVGYSLVVVSAATVGLFVQGREQRGGGAAGAATGLADGEPAR